MAFVMYVVGDYPLQSTMFSNFYLKVLQNIYKYQWVKYIFSYIFISLVSIYLKTPYHLSYRFLFSLLKVIIRNIEYQ